MTFKKYVITITENDCVMKISECALIKNMDAMKEAQINILKNFIYFNYLFS